MSAVASQITNLSIVYSTVYSRHRSKNRAKLHVTGLCAGNSPVTGEFPAQMASNVEKMFPFDDVMSSWWIQIVYPYSSELLDVVWYILRCYYMNSSKRIHSRQHSIKTQGVMQKALRETVIWSLFSKNTLVAVHVPLPKLYIILQNLIQI